MGTRSSTGFIHKEKYTGVYNQFDGYLGGVGKDVVKVLRALLRPDRDAEDPKKSMQEKLAIMKERLSAVKAVTNETPPTEEEQRMYMEAGFCDTDRLEIYKGFQKQPQEGNVFGLSVSKRSPTDWYCLLRAVQGVAWIEQAYLGKLHHILDGSDFPKDSVFCEYAYAINFDTDRLEIYKGFQKQPQEGNVFGTESDRDYFPCAKVIEFPLLDIPGDWMEQAEKAMGIEE